MCKLPNVIIDVIDQKKYVVNFKRSFLKGWKITFNDRFYVKIYLLKLKLLSCIQRRMIILIILFYFIITGTYIYKSFYVYYNASSARTSRRLKIFWYYILIRE